MCRNKRDLIKISANANTSNSAIVFSFSRHIYTSSNVDICWNGFVCRTQNVIFVSYSSANVCGRITTNAKSTHAILTDSEVRNEPHSNYRFLLFYFWMMWQRISWYYNVALFNLEREANMYVLAFEFVGLLSVSIVCRSTPHAIDAII